MKEYCRSVEVRISTFDILIYRMTFLIVHRIPVINISEIERPIHRQFTFIDIFFSSTDEIYLSVIMPNLGIVLHCIDCSKMNNLKFELIMTN